MKTKGWFEFFKVSRVSTAIMLLAVTFGIGFVGCNWLRGTKVYRYEVPVERGDGWGAASLSDVGMDKALVEELGQRIIDEYEQMIYSLQVVKDGYLVLDAHFNEARYDDLLLMERGTIGVTGQLMGIAIDRGLIASPEAKVFDYYPQYAHLATGQKADITLGHLMTMTSGLEWDETTYPYSHLNNSWGALLISDNQIEHVLSLPGIHPPGEKWAYNCGGILLLTGVLREAAGMPVDEFAQRYLFEPLQIRQSQWGRTNRGDIITYHYLKLRARDIVKIGYLMINDGMWQGNPVVPAAWVEESSRDLFQTHRSSFQYGITWYKRKLTIDERVYDMVVTDPGSAQAMLCIKELNMVALITGNNTGHDNMVLLANYIVKAAVPGGETKQKQ